MNEVEELCNRVAIIRAGRIVYEGAARRAARLGGRQLHAAHVRRRARGADLRGPRRACATSPSRPTACACARDEAAIEALSLELARSGVALRALVPDAASLEERFFALTEDALEPPPRRRCPSSSGWRDAAHAHGLPLGAAQARRAEAHLPRPRGRDDRAVDLRRRARAAERRARATSRSAATCATPGLAAPLVLLDVRLDLAVPADRLARRRRHRRRRGRQRHAQDDPHAQRHARPAVRGQGRRGRHLRAARARSRWPSSRSPRRRSRGASTRSRASRARPSRPGAGSRSCSRASASTRCRCSRSRRSACCSRPSPATRAGAVVGALMTALLMQLIGILPGVGAIKPYLLTTQFDAWHGFLRTPDRLGADHPRRLGLGDLRRRRARERLPRVPAPGRRRRLAARGRTAARPGDARIRVLHGVVACRPHRHRSARAARLSSHTSIRRRTPRGRRIARAGRAGA